MFLNFTFITTHVSVLLWLANNYATQGQIQM